MAEQSAEKLTLEEIDDLLCTAFAKANNASNSTGMSAEARQQARIAMASMAQAIVTVRDSIEGKQKKKIPTLA